jgi:hypothetical protein
MTACTTAVFDGLMGPPPPAPPACDGSDPRTFDTTDPVLAHDVITIYCDTCPIVAWCMDLVRPDRSYYDGVAAGALWRNGRPVQIDRQQAALFPNHEEVA